MTTFEQLRDVIAATLNVPQDKIAETTKDEDIGAFWDSIGHVNLMLALEETFEIDLDVEDIPKLNSVPAILQYLEDQGIA